MEADFLAHLKLPSALRDLIGDNVAWGRRPQGAAMPWVSLFVISRPRAYAMERQSRLVETRVQADVWGRDADGVDGYGQAKAAADALVARLSGERFAIGSTIFDAVFIDRESDADTLGLGGEQLYRRIIDLLVWHQPA